MAIKKSPMNSKDFANNKTFLSCYHPELFRFIHDFKGTDFRCVHADDNVVIVVNAFQEKSVIVQIANINSNNCEH